MLISCNKALRNHAVKPYSAGIIESNACLQGWHYACAKCEVQRQAAQPAATPSLEGCLAGTPSGLFTIYLS